MAVSLRHSPLFFVSFPLPFINTHTAPSSSSSLSLFFVAGLAFQDPNLFPMRNLSFFFFFFFFTFFAAVRSDPSDHRYKEGDPVPLYANKVGPFHNPRYLRSHSIPLHSLYFLLLFIVFVFFFSFSSETYRYFDLPFCEPGSLLSFLSKIYIYFLREIILFEFEISG